jgi:predicted metal-binding membrane protein
VRAGAGYSLNCIGTSLGPMVVLLAVGLTNITLMVIVTAIVLCRR